MLTPRPPPTTSSPWLRRWKPNSTNICTPWKKCVRYHHLCVALFIVQLAFGCYAALWERKPPCLINYVSSNNFIAADLRDRFSSNMGLIRSYCDSISGIHIFGDAAEEELGASDAAVPATLLKSEAHAEDEWTRMTRLSQELERKIDCLIKFKSQDAANEGDNPLPSQDEKPVEAAPAPEYNNKNSPDVSPQDMGIDSGLAAAFNEQLKLDDGEGPAAAEHTLRPDCAQPMAWEDICPGLEPWALEAQETGDWSVVDSVLKFRRATMLADIAVASARLEQLEVCSLTVRNQNIQICLALTLI